jgi:hypothetical protein
MLVVIAVSTFAENVTSTAYLIKLCSQNVVRSQGCILCEIESKRK